MKATDKKAAIRTFAYLLMMSDKDFFIKWCVLFMI